MPRDSISSREEEIWQKSKSKKGEFFKRQFEPFRREWKRRGPIEFANYILKIDPETGRPLTLSEEQKQFLNDIVFNNVKLAIISAGRGSGKSFVLAVYIAWRIFTNDFYHISVIGGSAEQSQKVRSYIVGWIRNNSNLQQYCFKSIKNEIKTYASSSARFSACSATSTRGEHVNDLIIDEEVAAEQVHKEEFIKAALWQASTSPDLRIIRSSTPHLTHGSFLDVWNNSTKYGYKRYQWSIAKHITKNKDPYAIYEDTNPHHWFSNVPWITDETIMLYRIQKSNEEWLKECLGAVSIASGVVFKPTDIDACICDNCEICEPYEEGKCPLLQYYLQLEGMPPNRIPLVNKEAAKYLLDKVIGIDWGKITPDCYSVIGRIGETVLVLDFREIYGQTDEEKIKTADELAKKWNIEIIRPDPEQWSYSNDLTSLGYSVHELFSFEGGQEKDSYVHVLKKYIERHSIKIPKIFEGLIRSLRNLSYDKSGKIRKIDDHPADSLLYAISYYGEVLESPTLSRQEIEKAISPSIPTDEQGKPETTPEDFNPFDIEYLKKKREEKKDIEGVKLW